MFNLQNFDDITVVIILYNSQEVIGNCLDRFSRNQKKIFVDNGSSDDSVSVVQQLRPRAKIIRNEKNRGYGPAANQALSIANTTYVLLINPDAILSSSNLLILHETAENNLNAGIVAPGNGWELHLRGPNGAVYDTDMTHPEGLFCTWFASGAIWLIRVSDCDKLGGFDENIFLYNEDFDYCLRLRKAGKSILICPDAEAKHRESGSTVLTNKIQWRKEWNLIWGYLYVTEKHFGSTKTKNEIYRLLLRHFPKMIFHGLVLERKRFRRDFAIVHAVVSFICGRQPKKT